MKMYIMVKWPFSLEFMLLPRFDECYQVKASGGQEDFYGAYFVPQDLFLDMIDNYVEAHNV